MSESILFTLIEIDRWLWWHSMWSCFCVFTRL